MLPRYVERLGEEARRPGIADYEAREAEALVQPKSPDIGVLYLQREPAAAALSSTFFCGGKKGAAYTLAPPFRKYRQVVDIQERSSLKRREPKETDCNANRASFFESEKHQRSGMVPQSGEETLTNVGAEWFASADGVGRIRVQDVEDPGTMDRTLEIRVYDVDVHFDCGFDLAAQSSSHRQRTIVSRRSPRCRLGP